MVPDFDYDGPALPDPDTVVLAGGRQPFVAAVQLRLLGRDLDVLATLNVLREVFTVDDVSGLYPARGGRVRLYAIVSRQVPLKGGIK